MQVLFDIPNFSCIMQLRAENQNLVSALSNYQQILYQFFDFTQNLKQSQYGKRYPKLAGIFERAKESLYPFTNFRRQSEKAFTLQIRLRGATKG